MKNQKFKIIFSLILLSGFFALGKNSQAMVFPGAQWQISTPAAQGVNVASLANALDYFDTNGGGTGTDEMIIIRNGYEIWKGPNSTAYHSIHSGTKTFTTTVLGLLIQEGKISSIDDQAIDYDPALDDIYPGYARITLRHLASMTSGYNSSASSAPNMEWGDPRNYHIPAAPRFAAGTKFNYFDPAIHRLGNLLQTASGETLQGIFKTRIADEIGMVNWEWRHAGYATDGSKIADFLNPSGIYRGGIWSNVEELARYGLLYLNRGNWNGQQLISADWVDMATTNQVSNFLGYVDYDRRGRFGFMWWINGVGPGGTRPWPSAPPKTYTFLGGFMQYGFVVPEWNMVIVRTSPSNLNSTTDAVWDGFFSRLAPGVSEIDVTPPANSVNLSVN